MSRAGTFVRIFVVPHGIDVLLLPNWREDEILRRDHFGSFPVGHEEEPVAVRLHQSGVLAPLMLRAAIQGAPLAQATGLDCSESAGVDRKRVTWDVLLAI